MLIWVVILKEGLKIVIVVIVTWDFVCSMSVV